ncbi:MAG TPA: alanine--glyoxylate aminotransferase family protein [Candidatus Sulfotelmatobacter sp.]|nr:alanine--glyoxylate aminotransferase family protein [Candidatus Sulfotelmatobacter sp.]
MTQHVGELNPPVRLMLTPGPSSVDPRVYRALATPLVGHMDPWFKGCMDETQILLRQIFQTENRITMPLSASGSGGIEASVVNVLEEGDEAIVAVNGVFSERMYEIATRASSKVTKVDAPYGKPVDPDDIRRAGKGKKIKMIGLAQGETSTGVLTKIDGFRKVADEWGALLVVDTVASLAAVPLDVDRERVDVCFSGSQKAISAPPGMSPITVSSAAEEVFRTRKTRVQSWYFDLTTAMNYWGKDRLYHHTPPISLIFALREAMRLVVEEGLETRWDRHRVNQLALIAGLEAMGLKLLVEKPSDRLPTVTAVMIPSGVDDVKLRNQLLDEFNIEIAGGFGPIKGKIWRVGLMGYSSQKPNVLLFLAALEKCLIDQGSRVSSGAGVGAAVESYTHAETPAAVGR